MNARPSPSSVFSVLLRLIVGGVLIYSGASKALVPSAEFAAALEAYKLLPYALLKPLAVIWPWAELLVGTYVLFGYYTRLFAKAAAVMFTIFLSVLISALVRGIDPGSCGCFGMGISLSVKQTAALDAVLLLLSLATARLSKTDSPYSADAWING